MPPNISMACPAKLHMVKSTTKTAYTARIVPELVGAVSVKIMIHLCIKVCSLSSEVQYMIHKLQRFWKNMMPVSAMDKT